MTGDVLLNQARSVEREMGGSDIRIWSEEDLMWLAKQEVK